MILVIHTKYLQISEFLTVSFQSDSKTLQIRGTFLAKITSHDTIDVDLLDSSPSMIHLHMKLTISTVFETKGHK